MRTPRPAVQAPIRVSGSPVARPNAFTSVGPKRRGMATSSSYSSPLRTAASGVTPGQQGTRSSAIAAASGVGVAIALERVPGWPGVTPLAAVRSGEEYELLVAMPRRFGPTDVKAFGRATGLPLTRIGACTAGRGVRMTHDGRPITPPPGFDHFPAQ